MIFNLNKQYMILIFEQDLTHYRASFYDYLSKTIKDEILILYGKGAPNSSHIFLEDDTDRNYRTLEISRSWIGKTTYFQSFSSIRKIINDNDVSCVIHRGAIRNLGLLRELSFFRKNGIPVILRGIGYSVRRDFKPSINLVDKYHKAIIDSSNAYLCYTDGSKKILDKFYSPEKIFVAVNTLNSNLLLSHNEELNLIGKEKIKKELKLKKDIYLIHIGRMSTRKKLDKLLDIYVNVKKKNSNIGLILIGDGVHKQMLMERVRSNNIEDVTFTGALSSEDILTSKYLFISDVMVIPGNLGLTVNHAFLFGKPVIGHVISPNQKRPKNYIHGPEHEYLIDGYNGITLQNEEVSSYTNAIFEVLKNPKYGKNAFDYAQNNLTVQKMTEGYINAMEYVIKGVIERK